MNSSLLLVAGIEVGHFRRPLWETQVADLIDSISRLGGSPTTCDDDYAQAPGLLHRLEAARWKEAYLKCRDGY